MGGGVPLKVLVSAGAAGWAGAGQLSALGNLERESWEILGEEKKQSKKKSDNKRRWREVLQEQLGQCCRDPPPRDPTWLTLLLLHPKATKDIPGRTPWLLPWELLQVASQPADLPFKKQGGSTMWVSENGMCLQPLQAIEHKIILSSFHKNAWLLHL